jgi:hypothetical protein
MNNTSPVTVCAITCPNCKHTIFSRAHHDMHSCQCGGVSIDGGFDYVKIAWREALVGNDPPPTRRIQVNASRQDLYADWNKSIDQWGVFPPECVLIDV